jgi:rhodanese-related sulfurtransferase
MTTKAKAPTTMLELKELVGKLASNEIILDVRTAEEYRDGHVPGSRNIPLDQLETKADSLKAFQTVYVHCQAGRRASMAQEILVRHGLTNLVCITNSGMGHWIAAGLPVEKGT